MAYPLSCQDSSKLSSCLCPDGTRLILNTKTKEEIMKTILMIFSTAFLFWPGCNENSQVLEPESIEVSNRRLITLPQPNGLSVENTFSVTKYIKGNDGGELRIDDRYFAGPHGEVKVIAKLKLDKNTFTGNYNITMTVDDVTGAAKFSPVIIFTKPATEFYLKFEGLDLSGVNPSDVKFQDFLPDGTVKDIDEIEALIVDVPSGIIELKLKDFVVRDVSINYNIMDIPGSRYGFSR